MVFYTLYKNSLFILAICFVINISASCDRADRENILVKLNGYSITRQDFEQKLNEYQLNLDVLGLEEKKSLKKMLIHELIEEAALLLEAKKRGLKVSQQEIDAQKEYKHISLKEEGMTAKQVDEKIERFLLIAKVQQDIAKEVGPVSVAQQKLFYKNNKKNFEQKKQYMLEMLESKYEKEAVNAYKKLGEEGFESLQVNMDVLDVRYTPAKWYEIDLLPKEIVRYLKSAKIDSISSILKSDYGYHIVKLIKVRSAYIPSFEHVKDEINALLLEEKKEKVLLEWKQNFFSQTKIERNYALIEKI
ncbi:MAG TPA: peptidyl-prolyl cis-trans isomerase [Oligoflexia bacterium]|nr:peptidyl-prolyl cis-trans isomerase [Oligoflexia bacterium]HMR25626.1 peptidyl-prolyl cis-trans isomerase [Oligoflexia bacterium]